MIWKQARVCTHVFIYGDNEICTSRDCAGRVGVKVSVCHSQFLKKNMEMEQ